MTRLNQTRDQTRGRFSVWPDYEDCREEHAEDYKHGSGGKHAGDYEHNHQGVKQGDGSPFAGLRVGECK